MPYSNVSRFGGADAYFCLAALECEVVEGGKTTPVTIRSNYTVECNLEGEGAVIINGKTHKIREGDVYVVLPGDKIVYYSSKLAPRRGIWCCIGGSGVGKALREAGVSSEQPFAPRERFSEVKSVIEKMIELRGERDLGAEYKRVALVYELLSVLTRSIHERKSEIWLSRAVSIMETRLNRPLSVSELALEVGFERSYFSVLFKEKMGVSPHEYLTRLRVRAACKELAAGTAVAEVSELVGLEPKNFARIFKRITGHSPLSYAKKYKK